MSVVSTSIVKGVCVLLVLDLSPTAIAACKTSVRDRGQNAPRVVDVCAWRVARNAIGLLHVREVTLVEVVGLKHVHAGRVHGHSDGGGGAACKGREHKCHTESKVGVGGP